MANRCPEVVHADTSFTTKHHVEGNACLSCGWLLCELKRAKLAENRDPFEDVVTEPSSYTLRFAGEGDRVTGPSADTQDWCRYSVVYMERCG